MKRSGKFSKIFFLSLLACSAIGGVAEQVSATTLGFTDRATFDATVPGASVENWDGFPAGTIFANGSTVNGITYDSSPGAFSAVVTGGFAPTSGLNSLGREPLSLSFFFGFDTITFGFLTPIDAFGIDINTIATANGAYSVTTNLGDIELSGFNPFPGRNTGQFIGFTSDVGISSVTFTGSIAFTLDTMRFAAFTPPIIPAPIPEPSTIMLFGSGLVGLVAWKLKKLRA